MMNKQRKSQKKKKTKAEKEDKSDALLSLNRKDQRDLVHDKIDKNAEKKTGEKPKVGDAVHRLSEVETTKLLPSHITPLDLQWNQEF